MNACIRGIQFLLLLHVTFQIGVCYINSTTTKEIINENKQIIDVTFYELSQYKLSTCIIAKNFSSMITSIFCYLFMEKKFKLKYEHLADFNWRFSNCVSKIKHKSLEELLKHLNYTNQNEFYKNWSMFLIIRNPIERFISGYIDKCTQSIRLKKPSKMCLYCVSDVECFVKKLYKIMNSPIKIKKSTYNGVKKHFFPQTMQCNYYKYKNNFKIIKYEGKNLNFFYNELESVLKKQNVSKSYADFISMEIRTHRIHHSTSNKKKTIKFTESLYKNKPLMEKLLSIYRKDFEEWNFQYPTIL